MRWEISKFIILRLQLKKLEKQMNGNQKKDAQVFEKTKTKETEEQPALAIHFHTVASASHLHKHQN